MFAQFGDPGGVVFAWVMVDRFLDAAMEGSCRDKGKIHSFGM
ncbi:hypothetical protein CSC32_3403 [Pseudomonas aeruginosa]|nr:hypothetical protein CSC32_3403 [Pseudomonas aeruginosa]